VHLQAKNAAAVKRHRAAAAKTAEDDIVQIDCDLASAQSSKGEAAGAVSEPKSNCDSEVEDAE
jgi:hypothetical protein